MIVMTSQCWNRGLVYREVFAVIFVPCYLHFICLYGMLCAMVAYLLLNLAMQHPVTLLPKMR